MLYNVYTPKLGYVVKNVPYDVAREKMQPFYEKLDDVSIRFSDFMRGVEVWAPDDNGGRAMVCRIEQAKD